MAAALAALPEVEARKRRNGSKSEARVSTTDPQAHVMKMGDGGFRPAYNVQFAADTASQVVVGVDVSPRAATSRAWSRWSRSHTAAGGCRKPISSTAASWRWTASSAWRRAASPSTRRRRPRAARVPPAWRSGPTARPSPPGGRGWTATKARPSTATSTIECVNAHARRRGLTRLGVRGLAKVRAVALWHAIAHNFARTIALTAQATA